MREMRLSGSALYPESSNMVHEGIVVVGIWLVSILPKLSVMWLQGAGACSFLKGGIGSGIYFTEL